MWNEPNNDQLSELPKLYETENIPLGDKPVGMHMFLSSSEWYCIEYCPESKIFFNFTILNGDLQSSELGYTSLDELKSIKVMNCLEVERNLYWKPKKFREVKRIVEAYKYKGLEDMLQ